MLVQISDPHIGLGAGAEERLAAAIDVVLALPRRPEALIVTGDLTADGLAGEYARVRELLDVVPMPVHVLAGNHDDRAGLRSAFGVPGAPGDPVRYAVRCGPLRVVACDTTTPGAPDGSLDVEWLAGQLAADPQTPTIVAMHHPPIAIGIPVMDAIGIRAADRAALAELLADSPQVRRVICGHVHRTAIGAIGGCPVVALSSTQIQHRLDLGAQEFDLVAEAPDVAVHVLLGDDVVSHIQPVRLKHGGRPPR